MSDLARKARAIAKEVAGRHANAVDREARFPQEAIAALREARLLGAMVPRDFGGEGASLSDIAAVCHELSQHCASTGMIYAMHQIQVACLVEHGQDSPWHRGLLARLASEQLLLASATTEAGIGGDVRSSSCAIEITDDRFTLRKNASVISYGADADGILVTARRTADAPPSDQIIVAVLKDDTRLEATSGWDTLGMRGTCSSGFFLEANGAAEQVLDRPYAEILARTMLPVTHIVWAAVWLGIATDAVARASTFIRAEARRKPGTTPPGALRLAEAVAMQQEMKSAVLAALQRYEAARSNDETLTALSFAVAMNTLKTTSSQAAVRIVNHALLVCGLAGYRNDTDYSLGRHLRDAHSAALMVSNDRILGNTANLLLIHKDNTGLLG